MIISEVAALGRDADHPGVEGACAARSCGTRARPSTRRSHEHGIVWARVRERGIAGEDEALAYFEWSLDVEHPDDVPDSGDCDPEYWRQVNFAIARGRMPEEHMDWERRAMSDRGFEVELLGVGDWPATDGSADVLVSLEEWPALEDPDSVAHRPGVHRLRRVARPQTVDRRRRPRRARARWQVEVIHARAGTGWLVERLVELYREHEIAEVVCDGYGPSAAIAATRRRGRHHRSPHGLGRLRQGVRAVRRSGR